MLSTVQNTKASQARAEPQEAPSAGVALSPEPGPVNPFTRAHDDLAAVFEEMRVDRDAAVELAESHRLENLMLRERVDSLLALLASRNTEMDRLSKRADQAVEDLISMKARFALIAGSIQMVIDGERKPSYEGNILANVVTTEIEDAEDSLPIFLNGKTTLPVNKFIATK